MYKPRFKNIQGASEACALFFHLLREARLCGTVDIDQLLIKESNMLKITLRSGSGFSVFYNGERIRLHNLKMDADTWGKLDMLLHSLKEPDSNHKVTFLEYNNHRVTFFEDRDGRNEHMHIRRFPDELLKRLAEVEATILQLSSENTSGS